MKKQKRTSGITLIALVVTIIVLLILAGIAIMMLTGENGILNKTAEAKVETIAGEVQEERDLWNLAKTTDKYSTTKVAESLDELLERLGPNNQKLLTSEQVEEIKTTGQVKIGSRTIVFGFENQFEIGDKVTATGLAKFKDSENQDIDWIYFGKDENGKDLITTAKSLELENQNFTLNPGGDTPEVAAKNWLYYDLQDTDEGYNDDECTTENNINKFCANLYSNLYSDSEDVVGKARSITLDDINRVTGFEPPEFNKYNFGTTNDYSDTSVTGNHTVDFYYPTLDAKEQNTNTDATPKVYKYWKKAKKLDNGNIKDAKDDVPCDTYIYGKDGDNYKLYWEGTARNWASEELSSTSTWKLETPENMLYVTGENSNYLYAIGSRSVNVDYSGADFFVAIVLSGDVNSGGGGFCYSDSDWALTSYSHAVPVRPIVSLESGVKLEKVQ